MSSHQAHHAVANFKSSDDDALPPPSPPVKEDPLRALTERGHQSVYNKGPPSAAESTEELGGAPANMEQLEALGPLQGEKDSGLKRASLDVELLAPRGPMAKETMLTFSNTLPRANANVVGVPGADAQMDGLIQAFQPAQQVPPVQRRLRVVQVPLEPFEPQQLVSDWKQKSLAKTPEHNSRECPKLETDKGGSQMPTFQPTVQLGGAPSNYNKAAPHSGAKAVVGPPPVSPKSPLTRAKWLEIREKLQGAAEPRLMQVIAMSKLEGLLPSSSSGETPETAPTRSTIPYLYQQPYELHKGPAGARGPNHPAAHPQQSAQIPVSTGNPNAREGPRKRGDPQGSYDLKRHNQGGAPILANSSPCAPNVLQVMPKGPHPR